ncbi:MAG: hypothetical protein J5645_06590 [Lachnospiraceae bacterium]|nr:hypothetical protein [Lachnospiraceae bacterium]
MATFSKGLNDLETWCRVNSRSDIIAEFDAELNVIRPDEIMYGSNSKVWWKCPKGHSYEAPVTDRTKRGRGCLFCKNRRVLKGYNDFETLYPNLVKEWDFSKNKTIVSPDEVTSISNTEVWWICDKGHSYSQRVSQRVQKGFGCPYCSGHRVLQGFNDLTTIAPETAKWWDYSKNTLKPGDFTVGSGNKAWWKCSSCGESFERIICAKASISVLCEKCVNVKRTENRSKSIVSNRGSLASLRKDLLKEWDYDANTRLGITPDTITVGSKKSVWWICPDCGNRWKAKVYSRTREKGAGCPLCGKEKASQIRYSSMLISRGSLAELDSQLLQEWDYEKNAPVTPKDVLIKSARLCWWRCRECGHSWKTRIIHRVNGVGCPNCSKERRSSFPEQAVYYYISQVFPDAVNSDQHIGVELDVYIPTKQVAIEYDGVAFHKSIEKDLKKNRLCEKAGIRLYRIRENGCPVLSDDSKEYCFYYQYGDWKALEDIILRIVNDLDENLEPVDINRDQSLIYSGFIKKKKENNLQALFPEIAKEWDHKKNGNVLPDMVLSGSEKSFWWICSLGHEWKCTVAARTNAGRGCPFCAKQKLLVGFNDFATCYPEVAKEWDYEKNLGLRPTDVIGGAKKIWWRCSNNHSYQSTMNSRTSNGTGCPYCSGHKAIEGLTDLFTERPELRKEWDFEKNEGINPSTIKRGSGKKVWWICPKGHSYDSTVVQRLKSDCPVCAGKRVIPGVNDFASKEPRLLAEWDFEKNTISPESITRMSGSRVWWKCPKGHSYQVGVSDRVQYGTKCPICCNKKILVGFNDLATTFPEVAAEWDYEKNDGIVPQDIGAGTARKYWWKCANCHHEWYVSVASRIRLGHGCPKCGVERSAIAKLKRIINVETGEIFLGIKTAKQKYPNCNIAKCLNGGSKTAGGYHWQFLENE